VSVFERYAPLYDLFYRQRDVEREVAILCELCGRHGSLPSSVLDLGCGTGAHLQVFARLGWRAAGVEQSQEMLELAQRRIPNARVRWLHGDATQIELGERFDLVVGLFHVLSYQIDDREVVGLLRTAALHAGSLVAFDFWYAPAVLAIGPEQREARVEGQGLCVTRTARPRLDAAARRIDVDYEFLVERDDGSRERFSELHRLRCFDADEIAQFCRAAGLEMCALTCWPGSTPPTPADWSALVLAKPLGT
jgi:SAM-dependent methyltransferase